MRPIHFINTLVIIASIVACKSQRKPYQLYKMAEFNLEAGNDFVRKVTFIPSIYEISLVDTKMNGNDFDVNGQRIFIDTTMTDQANYYSVKKRANELNVPVDSLTNCLKSFYKVGVNDFSRDSQYLRFKVIVGFTRNKGYIYTNIPNTKSGDTLPATSVRNRGFQFKVVLSKRIDKNWFEYYEIL